MRQLIVNADDLGYSANRNRGIIESVESGIVTSVSILVNFPATGEAIEFAKGADVGVALHMNLTEGTPLTDPSGRFPGKPGFRKQARNGELDPAGIEREMEAQLTRLLDAGVGVTHLDGHHHVHVFPPVTECAARIAKRFGIRWIRCPVADDPELVPMSEELAGELEQYGKLGAVAREVFSREALRFTDHFRGATLAWHVNRGATEKLIRRLPEGVTEYMVHPGYADPEGGFSGSMREDEVRILTDPGIRKLLEDGGVELTHFGKL